MDDDKLHIIHLADASAASRAAAEFLAAQPNVELTERSDAQALLSILAAGHGDLILLDGQPDDELDRIVDELVRGHGELALIVRAPGGAPQRAVELLRRGVWDVVLRDDPACLIVAVERCRREARQRRTAHAASRRFEQLFQQNPLPMALTAEGRFVDVNRAWLDCLGFSQEEVLGKTARELGIILEPARHNELAGQLKQVGYLDERELTVRSKSGELRHGLFSGELLPGKGGPDVYLTVMVDLTARKRVEAEQRESLLFLREAEEQLRQLSRAVEQSPSSVMITDTTGTIVYVNPKLVEVSGYESAEVRGQNARIFQSGRTPVEDYERLWRTILDGRDWHGELLNRKKNGELYWEAMTIAPISDPTSGEVTHFVAVKEDITERRRLEAELRQAQKLEAIGQLAGGVAHDFNNILAAQMMQIGLLQMNPQLEQETVEALRELKAGTSRAASLTNQLLMFSRRSVLDVKALDLNDVVRGVLKMLGRLIGEPIKLLFDGFTGALPAVEADAGMLEQTLVNLVVNARDAMPEGGAVTITTTVETLDEQDVATRPARREGRFVCLAVADTGTGMDEETSRRIFEPFFTTKEAGRGTGLGLATVHGIAAQHRGWVEVESELGRGSVFRLFLPALAVASSGVAEEHVAIPPRGRETILVVEDDSQVRSGLIRTLRALGYQVHGAADGQQALDLWAQHGERIDLLFTDMVMPEGMTGLELAERVRESAPTLPVIISSGYSRGLTPLGRPGQSGVTYLAKPYHTQTLAELVRSSLDQRVPSRD